MLTPHLLLVKFSTALICFCNNSDLCYTTEDRFLPYTNFPKRREYTKADSMNWYFKNMKGKGSALSTPTSVCIFSILFSIHFLWCWQGEFVEQSRASLVGDQFLDSQDLNVFFNVKHLQFAYVKNTAKKVTKASE